jgi:hypothetical protein
MHAYMFMRYLSMVRKYGGGKHGFGWSFSLNYICLTALLSFACGLKPSRMLHQCTIEHHYCKRVSYLMLVLTVV